MPEYGQGAPIAETVMVEHSQPNTHKAFHVGHLRNSVLGVAVSNILRAAGYDVQDANYIGDIGMHVVKCLWCYERFHRGEEPASPEARGRWLGEVYAESDARLNFRKDVLDFLQLLAQEDQQFVAAIDRMLKYLWRKNADGEDIAYLLGRIIHAQPIKEELLRQDDVIPQFWPIVGDQLRAEAEAPRPYVPVEGEPEPTMTPEERLARWESLAEHMDEWWAAAPGWRDEVRETFARWEAQEPEFVALWQTTRDWSMADFRRIFAELGATFDVWFFESEVEDEGKRMVEDLLERGIAEISEGLPVVKIDEKLGLTEPTYRTMPVLRSDGSSLYSTKDLALTKRKFEEYGVDRAIWVVDVRQSLYFQQIFKILELWGFEQARQAFHLGYEMVVLPEGVISSRKGNVPVYDDVRDAVLARARETIEEKNPELAPERKGAGRLGGGARLAEVRDAGARQHQGRPVRSGGGALLRRPLGAIHPVRARAGLPHPGACRGNRGDAAAPAGRARFRGAAAGGARAAAGDRVIAGRDPARGRGVPPAADRLVRLRSGEAVQRLLSRLPGADLPGADAHRSPGVDRGHASHAGERFGAAGDRGAGRDVRGALARGRPLRPEGREGEHAETLASLTP